MVTRPGEEGEGWMASREAEGSGTPREDPDSWRERTWRAVSDCCLTRGCLEVGSIVTVTMMSSLTIINYILIINISLQLTGGQNHSDQYLFPMFVIFSLRPNSQQSDHTSCCSMNFAFSSIPLSPFFKKLVLFLKFLDD